MNQFSSGMIKISLFRVHAESPVLDGFLDGFFEEDMPFAKGV